MGNNQSIETKLEKAYNKHNIKKFENLLKKRNNKTKDKTKNKIKDNFIKKIIKKACEDDKLEFIKIIYIYKIIYENEITDIIIDNNYVKSFTFLFEHLNDYNKEYNFNKICWRNKIEFINSILQKYEIKITHETYDYLFRLAYCYNNIELLNILLLKNSYFNKSIKSFDIILKENNFNQEMINILFKNKNFLEYLEQNDTVLYLLLYSKQNIKNIDFKNIIKNPTMDTAESFLFNSTNNEMNDYMIKCFKNFNLSHFFFKNKFEIIKKLLKYDKVIINSLYYLMYINKCSNSDEFEIINYIINKYNWFQKIHLINDSDYIKIINKIIEKDKASIKTLIDLNKLPDDIINYKIIPFITLIPSHLIFDFSIKYKPKPLSIFYGMPNFDFNHILPPLHLNHDYIPLNHDLNHFFIFN